MKRNRSHGKIASLPPELRNAVMAGMKKRRAELKNAIG